MRVSAFKIAGRLRLHPQVHQQLHPLHAPLFQLGLHGPLGDAAAPEEDDRLFPPGDDDGGRGLRAHKLNVHHVPAQGRFKAEGQRRQQE